MELTDFAKNKLWAIRQPALESMIEQIGKSDLSKLEKAIARSTKASGSKDYALRDGVAVIPVTGPLSKRWSFLTWLFGGTPMQELSALFLEAVDDPDVSGIVLDIDSPGGTVSGTGEFSDTVFSARGKKPIVAFGNGMMTSAAYWVGSSADRVVVEAATDVGSIGVVMVHWDVSEWDRKLGVKRTVLSAGKYKAVGNDAEPLTETARNVLQAELDYIYSLFVDAVARNRGMPADTVVSDMADGRVFIGSQAVDAGLADAVGNMGSAIAAANDLSGNGQQQKIFTGGKTMPKEIKTVEDLRSRYPDLVTSLETAAAEARDISAQVDTAAGDERARILGLAKIQFGADAGEKFDKIVASGVTVDQFQAIKDLNPDPPPAEPAGNEAAAVNRAKAETLAAIEQAGADNPGSQAAILTTGPETFTEAVEQIMAAENCGRGTATSKAVRAYPDLHETYLKEVRPQGNA